MSSPFRQALLALAVVAVSAVAMDHHYVTKGRGADGPIATAAAQSTAAAPTRMLSVAQGPVGPIPGPGPRAQPSHVNPYAGDAEALRNGRRTFVGFNCSGCHGDHAGGGMGPSLRDETWIYGGQADDIFDSIAAGRAHGMPAWGVLLPPQQIWQLVAYIQSMRTPQEPEPPAQ